MIRWLVAGLALAIATTGHAAAGRSEFAARVLQRLQAAAPDMELRPSASDPLVIEIEDEGYWGEARINLHRLQAFCRKAPADECDAVLGNFVASVTAEPPEPIAANLRVVVRQQDYLDRLRETQDADAQPIYRRIGDDLYALLAFAGPGGVLIAIPQQLGDLQLGEQAAWDLAGEQTRAALPRLPRPIDIVRSPISIEEGDLLTSLLADTGTWRDIAAEVGPDLVVAATTDRFVLVAALPADYRRMREFKRAVREACAAVERCISPNLYRFREGRWVIAE